MRAVATPDMHRVTANAVADRAAKTSAGAYSWLHARRCYATLRWASVPECHPTRWCLAYEHARRWVPAGSLSWRGPAEGPAGRERRSGWRFSRRQRGVLRPRAHRAVACLSADGRLVALPSRHSCRRRGDGVPPHQWRRVWPRHGCSRRRDVCASSSCCRVASDDLASPPKRRRQPRHLTAREALAPRLGRCSVMTPERVSGVSRFARPAR